MSVVRCRPAVAVSRPHPLAPARARVVRSRKAFVTRGLVAVATAALSLSLSLSLSAAPPAAGDAAPALALRDLDGRVLDLASFRGRPVIVNFWATWCAPCVAEMPSLMLLREKYAKQGLEILGVNLQENAARIRPFLAQYDLDFPVVRDHDGSARTRWGVGVYPSSFVIDRHGRVAFSIVGEADWTAPPIEPRVREVVLR